MKTKGSILLSLIFIILVSSIGLSLLSYSITHFQIIKARNIKKKQNEKLYNRLYVHLHNTRKKITGKDISRVKDVNKDFFNRENFPDKTIENVRIRDRFSFKSINKGSYVKIRGLHITDAYNMRNSNHFSSGSRLTIYSGDIPISLIPFFLTKKRSMRKMKYPNKSGVNLFFPKYRINISDKNLIKETKKYLNKNFISLGTIPISELLKKESDTDSKTLNSMVIFFSDISNKISMLVNTPVDKLTFSINKDVQIISIEKGTEIFTFKYIPKENYIETTDPFNTPHGIFSEKIVINGDIAIIKQIGDYAFTSLSEIVLTVFGDISISESLKTEQRGKKSYPPLTLISIANPYLSKTDSGGMVTLAGGGKAHLDLSIISDKEILNLNEVSELWGTLACSFVNNSGKLNLYSKYFSDKIDWIHLSEFTILFEIYTDYIEEIFNDK